MARRQALHPMRTAVAATAAAGLLATAGVLAAPSQAGTASRTASHPHHPPASRFTHGRVDNPWFPLKPGTRWAYRGSEDGDRTRDVMIATYRTRVLDGVVCRVVFDRVWTNGRLSERTRDFYAQTKRGTVWYFGERTAELDAKGHVTTREGSWMTGRDGARPGIFMTAHPRVGQTHQQEDFPGHAEDRFRIIDTAAAVRVPILATQHALLTKEWTPLEPGVVDHKYYVRDLGVVREVTVKGPTESLKLFSVRFLR
jgi:hypothetical protein